MTRDEILKQSTPRPWRYDRDETIIRSDRIVSGTDTVIAALEVPFTPSHEEDWLQSEANGMLIESAVNSHEADQQAVAFRDEAIEQATDYLETAIGLLNNADVELAHKPIRDALAALAAAKERQP